MRVSADPYDPGYLNYDPRYAYSVTVDGMEVGNVIFADEEEGCVMKAVLPIRAEPGDGIVTKTIYGKVVIDKALKGV